MKSILVMGGTTFVSSSLAKYLIEQGYNVDILTRGNKKIDYDGFREHLICDRKSRKEMQEVLKGRKYEFIFDISAYTKYDVEVLLSSTCNSLLKKYIFCSSGAVYKPSNVLIQECFEKGENPNWGKYGVNKKEAEDLVINSGLPYMIFRPTYIYGENNNLYREAYFFDRIRNNKAIPLPFGNSITTQFIHIDDLIRVFESSMNNKNVSKIYNVTNPEIVSWGTFITKCGEVVGKSPIIKKIDINRIKLASRSYFPFRDVTYMLDIKKLIEDGLYIPTISLEKGLKQTYQWYIDKNPNLNDVKMMSKVDELMVDYKLNLGKETEHFIIYNAEIDRTCLHTVAHVLEDNYRRITTNYKQKLQEKITIEIYSGRNELHTALGLSNAPDWIRGGIGGGKIIIASPLNPPPGSNFDNVLNTAVHEFTHIIVNKINENTPRWLNEGIAGYEAKDNDAKWIRETVKNGLLKNCIPTFKDLDTGEDYETFFKLNGYQYSYTIIESIIEEFGYNKLYDLIKKPNNFVDIFGITEKKMQSKWMEYIKNNYLCTS